MRASCLSTRETSDTMWIRTLQYIYHQFFNNFEQNYYNLHYLTFIRLSKYWSNDDKFNRRVHAHLTTLRATSSLTVFTSREKSWFNRVGRNWTYVSTSTAWSDCKDRDQAWLIYKSLKMSSYVEINLNNILASACIFV